MLKWLFARRYKLYVAARNAPTLGGRINRLGGIRGPRAPWLLFEEWPRGVFRVVKDNLTSGSDSSDPIALGICKWDSEVEDLDGPRDLYSSDVSQCFEMSRELQWKDVHITPYECCASSVLRLAQALSHVAFCAWCPGDI